MQRTKFPQTDRRTVLRTAAILGGSGVGLGAYSLAASEPAAALAISGFNAESRSVNIAPDEAITEVVGVTDLAYEWQVSHAIDTATFEVFVDGGSGEWHPLAAESLDAPPKTDSGQVTLSGSVLAASTLTASNFDAPDGSTISVGLDVKAVLNLIRHGEVIAVADKTASGAVAVTREALNASAALGGQTTWDVTVGTETPSG